MSGADNSNCMISDFGEFLSSVTMECQCELGLSKWGFKKRRQLGELPGGHSRWREKHRENAEQGNMNWNFSLAETES